MDYKKKYKEALEKARQLCGYPTTKPFISDLQDLFPELKESEDERIKKELIEFVKSRGGFKQEYIAWLEKQGKERTVNYPIEGMFPYTDPADTLDGEIENIWNKLRNCDNTFTAAKSGFYEVIHHFATWLEKQGYTKKDVDDAYLKGICNTKHELEKQDERKSTDKPKFGIGDEIKTDNEVPLIITKIDEQGYWSGDLFICSFEDSAKWELVGKIIDKVEPKFHEGDIIQFNGFGHNRYTIKNVCGLSHYINTIGEKMDMSYTDANFEVIEDSDKIKLCRAWSEEDDYNVQCLVAKANCDIQKGNVGRNEELIDWLKSLRNRVKSQPDMVEALRTEYEKGRADTIAEMKSSWSEEDEKMLEGIVNTVKDARCQSLLSEIEIYDDYIDWLESLKKRIGG